MLLTGRRVGCWRQRQRDHHSYARRGKLLCALLREDTPKYQLLDSFWRARGVVDPAHRKLLVDAAEGLDAEALHPLDSAPLATGAPLPGLPATWQLEQSAPEVLAASRRLLALQQMLGGGSPTAAAGSVPASNGSGGSFGGYAAGSGVGSGGALGGGGASIDVVWMVVREPGLLSADLSWLTARLLDMKLATYGRNVDVLRLVEAQPALLLSDSWQLDLDSIQAAPQPSSSPDTTGSAPASLRNGSGASQQSTSSSAAHGSAIPTSSESRAQTIAAAAEAASTSGPGRVAPAAATAAGGAGASTASTGPQADAVQQLVQAWQYGIASDGDTEWASRLSQLADYRARRGDTCVGFRDGDDPELARWATKQRADRKRGELALGRFEQLSALGFHFDADEAEWCRWFSELLAFKADTGHASPMPLVTGADMYLINWCSVQRIARRSRVLSESRIQRLDEAGFDWAGADPLS